MDGELKVKITDASGREKEEPKSRLVENLHLLHFTSSPYFFHLTPLCLFYSHNIFTITTHTNVHIHSHTHDTHTFTPM